MRPDHTYDEPDIEKRTLEAQFDDRYATLEIPPPEGPYPHWGRTEDRNKYTFLGFDWHTFPVKHFKILAM